MLACLVTALLVGAGIAVGAGVNALNSVKREPGLLPTNRNPVDPSTLLNKPMNFLLLGSDSRGQDRGRSDVMMLVHSDPDRAKLYLISLPRDLWVPIPGHGTDKINAAYAYGGAPLAVQTVENLLKVRIDNVALTDFTGFFRLIDDLGGVTVFNEIPSQSLGLSFPRGELTLTGETALVYVRERHDLPRGDFDRAERQRLVVKAIVDKLASRGTFSNPSRLLSVINRLSSTVTVDDSLTNQRIVALAQDLQITSGQDIDPDGTWLGAQMARVASGPAQDEQSLQGHEQVIGECVEVQFAGRARLHPAGPRNPVRKARIASDARQVASMRALGQ